LRLHARLDRGRARLPPAALRGSSRSSAQTGWSSFLHTAEAKEEGGRGMRDSHGRDASGYLGPEEVDDGVEAGEHMQLQLGRHGRMYASFNSYNIARRLLAELTVATAAMVVHTRGALERTGASGARRRPRAMGEVRRGSGPGAGEGSTTT
jgi:hypothetical protein